MKLEKTHRECLLGMLEKQQEELDVLFSIELKINEAERQDWQDWQDINKFLLVKSIELIKESIKENEIDF